MDYTTTVQCTFAVEKREISSSAHSCVQCQSLTNSSHYLSPRLIQLIGISRNKQNKTVYHQRCLDLSFYMPIISALPYLPLLLFVSNIYFFSLSLSHPQCLLLVLAAATSCTPTPASSLHCNGQLPVRVCAVCLY